MTLKGNSDKVLLGSLFRYRVASWRWWKISMVNTRYPYWGFWVSLLKVLNT